MTKHDRSYRLTCLCSDCGGTGYVQITSGSAAGAHEMAFVDCVECDGTGQVEIRPAFDAADGERTFAAADHARQLVGGEGW